jgi:Transposase
MTTGDLAREHGISEATLYYWKAKFGGMGLKGLGTRAQSKLLMSCWPARGWINEMHGGMHMGY